MKTIYIFNSILRIVAFICITIASIHFEKTSILWWYLVPMFMGISFKVGDDNSTNIDKQN